MIEVAMKNINRIFSKGNDVLFRFPMVITMSIIATCCAILLVNHSYLLNNTFEVSKFMIISFLGISLFFASKLASQRYAKWMLFDVIGIILLIIIYFILPKQELDFNEIYFYLLAVIFILSHLLVAFIAFFGIDEENKFWNFNKNLFLNLFSTVIFTIVLVGGVELALLTIEKLFDFNFDKTYIYVLHIFGILGSVIIFLLFADFGLTNLEKENNYPVVLKFFTQFILIPLLLIYIVILYFYAGKILINWELPRGWISYLIIAYCITGIFALLLVYPLKEETSKSWVKLFSNIFYLSLVPLLILLFLAIFTRILEYGYTEPRYLVLIISIWLTTVVLYFIFKSNPTIKFIPTSLFCFGLFAIAFPFFNAFSVAKMSQKKQLQELLIKNNLLSNGKIDFSKKLNSQNASEIADKLAFLAIRKQNDYLLNIINKKDVANWDNIISKNSEFLIKSSIISAFTDVETKIENSNKTFYIDTNSEYLDIKNYDFLINFKNDQDQATINNDQFKLEMNSKVPKFILILNSNERLDFTPYILSISSNLQNRNIDKLETEGNLGPYYVKIVFKNINVNYDYKNEKSVYINDIIILMKTKNK